MIQRFEKFSTLITALYKQVQKIKSQEMSEFDLKGAHVMLIFELNRNPRGLTITELADLCEEDKAAVSRNIAELTELGYVTSSGEKKYRMPIILTESGKKVADRIDQLVINAVEAANSGLNGIELDEFFQTLETISTNLNDYINK